MSQLIHDQWQNGLNGRVTFQAGSIGCPMTPPTNPLQRLIWVVLWLAGGPRLAHTGFGAWKPWVEYTPNELKILLAFANGSAFTSALLVTAGFSALFTSPGNIDTNGFQWQLLTVSATGLSAMASLHALLGFVRVTLYTKALQHVERFQSLSKKRKKALRDREDLSVTPRIWVTMVDVVTMASFHWMFRLSMTTILMYNICTQATGSNRQRWPSLMGTVMMGLFLVVLETIAYAAMASFEKGFPTDGFPTEDGEEGEEEDEDRKV